MALEVEGDSQLRARVRTPLDRHVDNRSNRPVHATDAPLVRWIEADERRGHRSVSEADAPRRETAVADLRGASAHHVTADDALLPLREPARIGGVSKHVLGRAVDLNAGSDRRH